MLMPSRVLTLSREELSMKQGRVAMPSRVCLLEYRGALYMVQHLMGEKHPS